MSFTFTLEHEDGSPAEPPTFSTAVPNWGPGDTISLGNDRTLHVVEVRPGPEPDGDPLLVVEAAYSIASPFLGKTRSWARRFLT